MKIALLNLPLDNNYGGNLQRYALMKVLQDMGHDVTHIYLKARSELPWYKWGYSYSKRIFKRYILKNRNISIFHEQKTNRIREKELSLTMKFYEKYIKHTPLCYSIRDVIKVCEKQFDVYLVGSDQVWRKSHTTQIGLENYFLKFAKNENIKRFAYAVSLGTDCNFDKKDAHKLKFYYSLFNEVSVREHSSIKIFENNNWLEPKPELCLDPTLLLSSKEYDKLIEEGNVSNITEDKIFAYILDNDQNKNKVLESYKHKLKIDAVVVSLTNTSEVSIPQWLNNIKKAEFIITDSYHGVVFSIIFRRPFLFLGNKNRGNNRVESILKILELGNSEKEVTNYMNIDKPLKKHQHISFSFLKKIR